MQRKARSGPPWRPFAVYAPTIAARVTHGSPLLMARALRRSAGSPPVATSGRQKPAASNEAHPGSSLAAGVKLSCPAGMPDLPLINAAPLSSPKGAAGMAPRPASGAIGDWVGDGAALRAAATMLNHPTPASLETCEVQRAVSLPV